MTKRALKCQLPLSPRIQSASWGTAPLSTNVIITNRGRTSDQDDGGSIREGNALKVRKSLKHGVAHGKLSSGGTGGDRRFDD